MSPVLSFPKLLHIIGVSKPMPSKTTSGLRGLRHRAFPGCRHEALEPTTYSVDYLCGEVAGSCLVKGSFDVSRCLSTI